MPILVIKLFVSIFVILGAIGCSALFAVLAYEYHFGTGYGLVGWASIPASLACLWMFIGGLHLFLAEVTDQLEP
jgi:hypothetical protein